MSDQDRNQVDADMLRRAAEAVRNLIEQVPTGRGDAVRRLDHFATSLDIMFPANVGIVHCGSSLERADYRDVDVRIVLRDPAYRKLAKNVNVLDLNMLLSGWGQRVVDLPIDCQVQSLTESGNQNGTRHGITRSGRYRRALDAVTNPQVTADQETT